MQKESYGAQKHNRLVTRTRHTRGVPCVDCAHPPAVAWPRLLWVCRWVWLPPRCSWLEGPVITVSGQLVCSTPRQKLLFWEHQSQPWLPPGGRRHFGRVPTWIVFLAVESTGEHQGRVSSARQVDRVLQMAPISTRPARQKKSKKNGSCWCFHSQRKFLYLGT